MFPEHVLPFEHVASRFGTLPHARKREYVPLNIFSVFEKRNMFRGFETKNMSQLFDNSAEIIDGENEYIYIYIYMYISIYWITFIIGLVACFRFKVIEVIAFTIV